MLCEPRLTIYDMTGCLLLMVEQYEVFVRSWLSKLSVGNIERALGQQLEQEQFRMIEVEMKQSQTQQKCQYAYWMLP